MEWSLPKIYKSLHDRHIEFYMIFMGVVDHSPAFSSMGGLNGIQNCENRVEQIRWVGVQIEKMSQSSKKNSLQ